MLGGSPILRQACVSRGLQSIGIRLEPFSVDASWRKNMTHRDSHGPQFVDVVGICGKLLSNAEV